MDNVHGNVMSIAMDIPIDQGRGCPNGWCAPNGFSGCSHPSRASSSTTILKNCGRGESLWTTTCLKTVVGGRLPVKYGCSTKPLFCVSGISWRSYGWYKDEVNLAMPSFGDITWFENSVSMSEVCKIYIAVPQANIGTTIGVVAVKNI